MIRRPPPYAPWVVLLCFALGCGKLVQVGQDLDGNGDQASSDHEECADGIDDDADGTIDEGCWCAPGETQACYSGPHRSRGLGACVDGTQECVTHGDEEFGQWSGTCTGDQATTRELCDGRLDDDCDGAVDEGCPCRAGAVRECGPADVGLCSPGQQRCTAEQLWTDCEGAKFAAPEICGNLKDEDCDGEADETCGCVPAPEQCHSGVDEDCDGEVDEPACDPRRPPCGEEWFTGEVCTTDCWCWREPELPVTEYRALWGDGAGGVWAVGADGVLVRRSGNTWSGASGLVPGALLDLSGSGADDVWAVGEGGAVVHWDGSQLTARRVPGGPEGQARGDWLWSVWASSPTDVWAGGAGRLLHYDGSEWRESSIVLQGTIRDLWASSAEDVWALESVPGPEQARLHRWGGTSWRSESLPTTEQVEGIWGTGPGDVWIVARDGVTLHHDGSGWQQHDFPGQFRDVHGAGGAVWAVTEREVVLWDDAASSWSPQSVRAAFNDEPPDHAAVWAEGEDSVFVVGRGGSALRRGSEGWEDARGAALSFGHTADVWASSPDDVWSVGRDGAIARWEGDGWSTATVPNARGVHWRHVDGTGPDNVWIGAAEPATTAHWDGSSWQTFDKAAQDLTVASEDGVWIVEPTTHGEARLWRWDGRAWQSVAAPDDVAARQIWASGPEEVWLKAFADSSSVLFHWDGDTWSPEEVPCESGPLRGTGPEDVWFGWCHWDGTKWTRTREDGNAVFSGISPSAVWATTWSVEGTATALQWNGAGWRREIIATGAPAIRGDLGDGLRPRSLHAMGSQHVWLAGNLLMHAMPWADVRGFVVRRPQ
jgi:hypothetical protein